MMSWRTLGVSLAPPLPLLVDVDTGWGGAFNIARTVKDMIKAGAAGMHIEDQVAQKRCGHRPNKEIVTREEMVDRIKASVDAKTDDDFMVMARTDALAVVGLDEVIERAVLCEQAGANAIFAEAMTDLSMYQQVTDAVSIPVLANITEFASTPLYTTEELASVDIAMALYPLSAFRAMNKAALEVYTTLRQEGTQASLIDKMQTRAGLYDFLGYHAFEQKLDELFRTKPTERVRLVALVFSLRVVVILGIEVALLLASKCLLGGSRYGREKIRWSRVEVSPQERLHFVPLEKRVRD